MKNIGILLLIFCYGEIRSQAFKAEATIPTIEADGFYRIAVPPRISIHLNNDFSDIRIYDSKNQEVPYIFQQESPPDYANRFTQFETLITRRIPDCCTWLALKNPRRTAINNVNLMVSHPEPDRSGTLLGSDDMKNWFTIKDRINLHSTTTRSKTFEVKISDLTWSNYEFYGLLLDDGKIEPFNILSAGYYEINDETEIYTEIAPHKISTTDSTSEKKTFVTIVFNRLQFLDKITVEVEGAKYYRRRATLFEKRVKQSKKGTRTKYYRSLRDFVLTSGRTAILEIPNLRTNELLLVVENEDNPPLHISSIKALQLKRYLVASLNKNEEYNLKFGQPKLQRPVYDLVFFKDSVEDHPQVLEPGKIKFSSQPEMPSAYFTSKTIIWIAIVGVVLVLGLMSIKLVRDSSKKTKD